MAAKSVYLPTFNKLRVDLTEHLAIAEENLRVIQTLQAPCVKIQKATLQACSHTHIGNVAKLAAVQNAHHRTIVQALLTCVQFYYVSLLGCAVSSICHHECSNGKIFKRNMSTLWRSSAFFVFNLRSTVIFSVGRYKIYSQLSSQMLDLSTSGCLAGSKKNYTAYEVCHRHCKDRIRRSWMLPERSGQPVRYLARKATWAAC